MNRVLPPFVRDFISQGSAGYSGALFMFLRGLAVASFLSPFDLGVVATVSLITSMAQYMDLGGTSAMEQRIPELRAAAMDATVRDVQNAGFAGKLFGTSLASAGLASYLVMAPEMAATLRIGLWSAVALFPMQGVFFAQQAYMRGSRLFNAAARHTVCYNGLNLIGAVIGGASAGFTGIVVAQVTTATVSVAYGIKLGAPPSFGRFRRGTIGSLLILGWPLLVLSVAQYSLIYIDQVVALTWLGRRSLGAYSLVTSFGSVLYFVPMSVSAVIAPRLLGRFATERRIGALREYCWKPTETLRRTMPVLIGLAWALVWFILHFLLREYEAVTGPAALVYMTSIYFLSVNLGPSATLIALRRHTLNVPIIFSVVVANFGLDWLLLRYTELGLPAIAWGSAGAYALYMTLHLGLVARHFGTLTQSFEIVLSMLWPGLLLCAAAWVGTQALSASSLATTGLILAVGCGLSAALFGRDLLVTRYPYSLETSR